MASTKSPLEGKEIKLKVIQVTRAVPGVVEVGDLLVESPKYANHWIRVPHGSLDDGVDLDSEIPKVKA